MISNVRTLVDSVPEQSAFMPELDVGVGVGMGHQWWWEKCVSKNDRKQ